MLRLHQCIKPEQPVWLMWQCRAHCSMTRMAHLCKHRVVFARQPCQLAVGKQCWHQHRGWQRRIQEPTQNAVISQ